MPFARTPLFRAEFPLFTIMKCHLVPPAAIAATLLITTGVAFADAPATPGNTSTLADTSTLPYPLIPGKPYLAAYRWGAANSHGGAKANEAYAKWLGQPVVWAEDFEPIEQWDNNIEGGSWQLPEWQAWKAAVPGRRLILSVPLLPGGWDRGGPKRGDDVGPVSWTAAANGDYNIHFQHLAENLVKYNLGDSVLRLGWEFNGGWYTWRASDNPKAFATYWQNIVTTMRAVPGAQNLQFCFNPALGWLQFPADQAYPGDQYVDIIGLDIYDDSWAQGTYPIPVDATPDQISAIRQKVWDEQLYGGNKGLKYWRDFAVSHHKLFALPEWGVDNRGDKHSGGDSPFFIQKIHDFITDPANNVYFACYFDVQAGDGHHQLSTGINGTDTVEFPNAAAEFLKLFGQTSLAALPPGTPTTVANH